MSLFGRDSKDAVTPPEETGGTAADGGGGEGIARGAQVPGERGIPSVNRVRSAQSRVSSLLTVTFASLLAAGLLTWYYSGAFTRAAKEHAAAKAAQQRRAQGDSSLPPLGPLHMPAAMTGAASSARGVGDEAASPTESTVEHLLGPTPASPLSAPEIPVASTSPYGAPGYAASPYGGAPRPKSAAQLTLDRQLGGPVLTKTALTASAPGADGEASGVRPAGFPAPAGTSAEAHDTPEKGGGSELTLGQLLKPTEIAAVRAQILPTQRFLLAKGAFIDCTLETAINSALPGMTTCVTATDTFSADGKVVLLERGTKLVGETRGEVQQGSPRLFVLWTQARTPTGIVVPLVSPGTDELGRSGLTGNIDRHWWERFGSAILITVIDGLVQAETQRQTGTGGTVVLNPSSTSEVLTDVLRNSINIRPTIDKAQGDRIQILVARDVDFRSVYTLHADLAGTP